jgi:hypothetical protein
MFAVIVEDDNNERVVLSTKNFIFRQLQAFLRDTYDCNDVELERLTYTRKKNKGTFKCDNFTGTFRIVSISTV